MSNKPVEAVLLGAGSRGRGTFGKYATDNPDKLKIVALAEPNEVFAKTIIEEHNIPKDKIFSDWESLLNNKQLAPLLINATNDKTHYFSAINAMDKGYDVILEKPIATKPEECSDILKVAKKTNRKLWVTHNMRYSTFFETVFSAIQNDYIGEVMSVRHNENVAFWHMAHSFVRSPKWNNSGTSAPMILAKSCHDVDVLLWTLGKIPDRISSFGSLLHYKESSKPDKSIPKRCTDGCPVSDDCPYFAPRLYIEGGSPLTLHATLNINNSKTDLMNALKTTDYGLCVYHAGNNVVDRQVVNMEFDSGPLVTLIMHGHAAEGGRSMRYDGTKGTLIGKFGPNPYVEITNHKTGEIKRIEIDDSGGQGHGGGDEKLLDGVIDDLNGIESTTHIADQTTLAGHLICFAAEESRLSEGKTINLKEYFKQFK